MMTHKSDWSVANQNLIFSVKFPFQPQATRGGGGGGGPMSILMPLYTIGIVIFFVYTIMKVSLHSAYDGYEY